MHWMDRTKNCQNINLLGQGEKTVVAIYSVEI
jgi:hypothetical protein